MLEKNLERKIADYLHQHNIWSEKFHCPRKGAPDRIVFLPAGKVFFLETKTKFGKATPHQDRFISSLRNLSIPAAIVNSYEEARCFILKVVRDVDYDKFLEMSVYGK